MSADVGSLNTRGISSQRSALELEGSLAGELAAPVVFAPGQINCKCGTSLSKDFYRWVGASVSEGATLKSGAIIIADFPWIEKARVNFTGGRIVEVGFPELAGASTESGKFEIVLDVASMSQSKVLTPVGPLINPIQKKWLCSCYQLSIPGIDTSGVTQIAPFRVRKGNLLSELILTVRSNTLAGFNIWLKSREPKDGILTYLFLNLQTFCTLTFKKLGIAAVDNFVDPVLSRRFPDALLTAQVHLKVGGVTFSEV